MSLGELHWGWYGVYYGGLICVTCGFLLVIGLLSQVLIGSLGSDDETGVWCPM